MDERLKTQIAEIMDRHRIMSLATVRPDGWPHATTVGYVRDGLTLFFLCAPDSQKAINIAHDERVAVTINGDSEALLEIQGLSIAARAAILSDVTEKGRILGRLAAAYPEQAALGLSMPPPEAVCIVRLTPAFISVIDYTKGFGHTDLVTC